MGTIVQVTHNGKWVEVPNGSIKALELGWHKGTTYDHSSWFVPGGRPIQIEEWCKERFDRHHYRMFANSIWFIDPNEALICQLRWS